MAVKKAKVFFIFLILFAGLVWGAAFQLPGSAGLHLVFCDVGQGDAALVTYRTTQVLIDGGPNNRVLDCLSKNMPFWDRTIEMIILTHPEADHFTGLIDVVKRYNVKQFVINSIIPDSAGLSGEAPEISGVKSDFWEFRQVVLAEETPIYSPKAGEKFKVGSLELTVLWPEIKMGDSLVWQKGEENKEKILGVASFVGNLNETSIVLQLVFGDFDALLTGDISSKIEAQLAWSRNFGIEVFKVAHHGSKYSSSEAFLAKVKPELAVISVGKNPFGHPTKEVLDRLTHLGIDYLRTDQDGEIKIVSDGKSWYTRKR